MWPLDSVMSSDPKVAQEQRTHSSGCTSTSISTWPRQLDGHTQAAHAVARCVADEDQLAAKMKLTNCKSAASQGES